MGSTSRLARKKAIEPGDLISLAAGDYAPKKIYVWGEEQAPAIGDFSSVDLAIVISLRCDDYAKIVTSTGLVGVVLSESLEVLTVPT